MRRHSAFLLVNLGLIFSVYGADAEVRFKYVSAGESAQFALNPNAPNVLASDGRFSMSLRTRNASGHVEKHMGWNEELVIQEGNVVLNYGGTGANARKIAPGEFNADSILGGKSIVMHAGDIVIIPAGTWHEEVLRSPTMRYILFKTKK